MSAAIAIQPGPLSGMLAVPPSKSVAHRAVIAAALAKGESRISNLEMSQDIAATVGAMRAFGAEIRLEQDESGRYTVIIHGIDEPAEMPLIDCGESGSTLRFLIPVALAVAGGAQFTGSGRLGQRSLWPYEQLCKENGIVFDQIDGGFPLKAQGCLKPGRYVVPGNVSSQFVTGLLLALPLLPGPSTVMVKGKLESLPYVDITLDMLRRFGVVVGERQRGVLYQVVGKQAFQPQCLSVEGDWSQAAFLLLMGLLSGPVILTGLDYGSAQGDRVIQTIFREMGGALVWEGDALTARQSSLHAISADVSQCPDLAPAIAAAMAMAGGESRITGGRRLRDKESDRIAAIADCLNGLGADVTETEDGMIIRGKDHLTGGTVDSCNDHRIAMMAAAVLPACAGPVILSGHVAVKKSWPGFWDAFRLLGGVFDEQHLG